MSVFFFKSLLGIGLLISAVIAAFTMLEIFGRSERKYDIEKLKKDMPSFSYLLDEDVENIVAFLNTL